MTRLRFLVSLFSAVGAALGLRQRDRSQITCMPVEEAFRDDPRFPQFSSNREVVAKAHGWEKWPPERAGVGPYWQHDDCDIVIFTLDHPEAWVVIRSTPLKHPLVA